MSNELLSRTINKAGSPPHLRRTREINLIKLSISLFETFSIRLSLSKQKTLVFAPDKNPVMSLEFSNFSRFIGVTGHLYMRTVFTTKSTEDLKSKYKPESDYYLE